VIYRPIETAGSKPEPMKESLLKMYFWGQIAPSSLKAFLDPVRQTSVLRTGEHFEFDLLEEYEVALADLKMICDHFLCGELGAVDVEALAFFLLASDNFVWDKGTEAGAVIAQIIHHWNCPEICFPITPHNMRIISRGLEEGVYDTQLLKMR